MRDRLPAHGIVLDCDRPREGTRAAFRGMMPTGRQAAVANHGKAAPQAPIACRSKGPRPIPAGRALPRCASSR